MMHYFYDGKSNDIYQHFLVPAAGNKEGLFQMTKYATLKPEVKRWLNENIGACNWRFVGYGIGFIMEEDAMAFLLMWS